VTQSDKKQHKATQSDTKQHIATEIGLLLFLVRRCAATQQSAASCKYPYRATALPTSNRFDRKIWVHSQFIIFILKATTLYPGGIRSHDP
jgi:hypothetical protein